MSDIEVTIEQSLDHIINGEIVRESGSSDYNELENKPSINGVELNGNLTTEDLGINVDTSNLVTKEELESKGYLTQHQDISNLATKDELSSKADKSNVYTKSEIDLMIGDIETAIRSL